MVGRGEPQLEKIHQGRGGRHFGQPGIVAHEGQSAPGAAHVGGIVGADARRRLVDIAHPGQSDAAVKLDRRRVFGGLDGLHRADRPGRADKKSSPIHGRIPFFKCRTYIVYQTTDKG